MENHAGGSFSPNLEKGILSWLLGRNTTDTGEFFSLVFEIKSDAAAGVYPITLSLTEGRADNVVDETAAAVPAVFEAGAVTVEGEEPEIPAQPTAPSGGSPAAETPAEEAVVEVKAEITDGGAKASVDADTITEALENTEAAESITVKVESEDTGAVELNMDAEAVKTAAEADTTLRVETDLGVVTISSQVLSDLAAEGGEVSMTIEKNDDGTMTLGLTVDGESADVPFKVALPASDSDLVLVAVNENGEEEIIKKSIVEDGQVFAEIPAGSVVKTVENKKTFIDVKDSDWFSDHVDFVASHELFQGVSETEFAPQEDMTRAMLVTVMYRLENEPEGYTGVKFGDVKEGSWYEDAVAWASETGIVKGTGEGFAPDDSITREQIATVFYRYAEYLGLDVSEEGELSEFPDGGEVSSWAKKEMAWAVKVGLFRGDQNGNLNPQDNATRAEVATLMERIIALIVK